MAARSKTALTSKTLKQILPQILKGIDKNQQIRPDRILAAWPSIIGERIAPMTKAISFIDGVLTIKVRNSSLLSLLATQEKARLLKELRKRFPYAKIKNLRFSIG